MTSERYKVDGESFWLWEKTEGHCEVCQDFGDWYGSIPAPPAVAPPSVTVVDSVTVPTTEVISGGSTTEIITGQPTVTSTSETMCMDGDGNVIPCDQIPEGAMMVDGGSSTSSETITSSGTYELTFDAEGNPIFPDIAGGGGAP